jgi:hypothetical protein
VSTLEKQLSQKEEQIEKLRGTRHDLYRRFKLEHIDLPLLEGEEKEDEDMKVLCTRARLASSSPPSFSPSP